MTWLENFWDWLFKKPLVFGVMRVGPVELAKNKATHATPGKGKPVTRGNVIMVITDEQQVRLKARWLTEAGNVAKTDGPPEWKSSNPDIVEVIVDTSDPAQAIARRKGPAGQSQISATADADLQSGEGHFRPVAAVIDIEVVPAEAVTAIISADTPSTAPPLTPTP